MIWRVDSPISATMSLNGNESEGINDIIVRGMEASASAVVLFKIFLFKIAANTRFE